MTAQPARLLPAIAILVWLSGCCSARSDRVMARARARLKSVELVYAKDFDPVVTDARECADAPLVSREELARGDYAGKRVAIDGRPVASGFFCTEAKCTDPCGRDVPCCNHCGALKMVLRTPGQGFEVEIRHPNIGCGGLDCHRICVPFGDQPQRDYRFMGTMRRSDSGNGYVLDVERWCGT